MSDYGAIVDVEGVIVDALEAAGIAASSLIRVDPNNIRDSDLERMPYVHVEPVEGGEASDVWRMDPYLLTCYGSTPAEAFALAARVVEILDWPMLSPRYGLVDCCDVQGPTRDPNFGDNGDDLVNAQVLHVQAESRRG